MTVPKKRTSFLAVILFLILLGVVFSAALRMLTRPSDDGLFKTPFLGKKVALVRLEGVIVDGREIIKQLKRWSEDDSVKAIVIRIISPGGGVAPSQEIFNAVKEANSKKPVVASMGGVAASGGYYVASACEKIVANPGTITGSIGVIMIFSNTEKLMGKLGLGTVVVKSGKFKDTGAAYRPFTEEDRELMEGVVSDIYTQFITDVSETRGMDLEKVRKLADGRIYTGKQALGLKLVDELGDLKKAVNLAGRLGGIEGEPEIVEKVKEPSIFERLFGEDFEVKVPSGLNLSTGAYFLWPSW